MPTSFTVAEPCKKDELVSDCHIARAHHPEGPKRSAPVLKQVRAIWDTGATQSVISLRMVEELRLTPISVTVVRGANHEFRCSVYLITIMLPHNIVFPACRVTGQNLKDYDALIGMDIIGTGDFAVTNLHDKTVFSFRHPSMERIDFMTRRQ